MLEKEDYCSNLVINGALGDTRHCSHCVILVTFVKNLQMLTDSEKHATCAIGK